MTDNSELSASKKDQDMVNVGSVLRSARESASYSVAYVASQTHLQEDVITALENNQFDQLPGAVFVRGYIRSYAKLLEIDAQPLISACPDPQPKEVAHPENKKKKKIKSSGADPVVIWSSVTVMVLMAGLLITWWVHKGEEPPVELASVVDQFDDPHLANEVSKQIEHEKAQEAPQHQIGLGDVDPKHTSVIQNTDPVVSEEIMSSDEIDNQRSSLTRSEVIEAPFSGGELDKVRITVRYTQESWTEIFDARKRRLLHGLIKPGATRVISGQAPFNVFLGNSPGVQLEINGKPFDHSEYIRRNNTARFLIDDINT